MFKRKNNAIVDQLEWFLSEINNGTNGHKFNELFLVRNYIQRSWPDTKLRRKEELAVIVADNISEKNEDKFDYYLAILEGESPYSIICFYQEESNLIELLENVNRESDVTIFENFSYRERFLKIDNKYYELKYKGQESIAINEEEFNTRISKLNKNIAFKTNKP